MVLPTNFGGMMTKQCNRCKTVKDISMFYRNNTKKDGRQTLCSVCHNEGTKKWRKANPESYKKSYLKQNNRQMNAIKREKSKIRSRQFRHYMTDQYLRDIMTLHTDLNPEDIPDDLVKLQRANLALKRKLGLTKKLKGVGGPNL